MTSGKDRTKEEIEQIVNDLGYMLLNEYFSENRIRRVVVQDKIGYKYDTTFSRLLNNQHPDFISKSNPYSLENIALWLKLNRPEFKLNSTVYLGAFNKLKLYHRICKETFEISWSDLYNGYGCGICVGKQVGKYNNLAYLRKDLVKEWHPNNKLKPEDITEKSSEEVCWICSVCGYGKNEEWKSPIYNRANGRNCPKCAVHKKESVIATELKQWTTKIFKEFCHVEYKTLHNSDTSRWLPFDIYIGLENSTNGIFIEIHGEQHYKFVPYWHKTKEQFEYNKKLDGMKKRFAKKNGTYVEIDLRKIKTVEQAIQYLESRLPQ